MKRDEFIERIREGIEYNMWIRDEMDKQSMADGKLLSEEASDSMRTWMAKQIQSMLDNMTMLDIIYISDNGELSPTGESPRYGDIRMYKALKRKGGQAPEDSSAVDNDEKGNNSSHLSISEEG